MNNQERAIDYWTMGQRFLRMANVTSEVLVKTQNPWIVTSDKEISTDEYDEKTKWSDHNIAIPVLFNFYHGLELMIKGFLLFHNESEQLKTHKFTVLINLLKKHLSTQEPFIKKIESYTINIEPNSIFRNFLETNCNTIDNWYESLKYPEKNEGNHFIHIDLMYGSKNTLNFWEKLSKDSLEIIKLSRQYHLSKGGM